MPLAARFSGVRARRSSPSKVTLPAVTEYVSRPASTPASVLLPEPFGPMMACTSPALTSRSSPCRMSRSATVAFKPWMLSMVYVSFRLVSLPSSDRTLQAHPQQLLSFHRKLHRQLLQHLPREAVHDHGDRGLLRDRSEE